MGDGNQNKIEKEVVLDAERWKSIMPPFLRKTYLLVEDPKTDDIISWNAQGTGFVVWRPVEFARDLLPTIFKHSNFSSFVRQLNTYGFRKTVPRRWEFCNDKFRKDKRELLSKIKRRRTRNTHKTPSSTAATVEHNRGLNLNSSMLDEDRSFSTSLSDYDSLCEENVRLREDNKILYQELQSMKNKCKELLDLVSTCVNRDDEKERPKLFGVRLEVASGERMKNRSRGVAEEILKYKKFLNLSVPMKVQMHA